LTRAATYFRGRHPSEDAVVFSDVRCEFPVESLAFHQLKVPLFELLSNLSGLIIERQFKIGDFMKVVAFVSNVVEPPDEFVVSLFCP
jgi:hypothetical protein